MASRSVLIHCNADLERGMGHLMRALCLAEEATSRGWEVAIVGQFGGRAVEHVAELFPSQELIELGDGPVLQELAKALIEHRADLLHLDSYDVALDPVRFDSVQVSNMQDGKFGRRPADLQIDANLDAETRYAPTSPAELALLGIAAVQVRREVRAIRHQVRPELMPPYRVLVVLGGTDPFNLTPQVVQELLKHSDLELTVICRPETQPALLRSLGAGGDRVEVLSFTGDLPGLADSMDAVITAAGTSVWDFASAGIPMGIVAVTENQLLGYSSCASHDIGFPLGVPPYTGLADALAAFMVSLQDSERVNYSVQRGKSAIDGLGAWRVVSAWEELVDAESGPKTPSTLPSLSARLATASDARLLLEWRNDPSTRDASRSHQSVSWVEHLSWMTRVLDDENRRLLVIEQADEPVATVRWDRQGLNAWEVSITIAPAFRGKGLGRSVLSAGEHWIADGSPIQLLATIHSSNSASQRLFANSQYLPHLPADEEGFGMRAKWLLPSKH